MNIESRFQNLKPALVYLILFYFLTFPPFRLDVNQVELGTSNTHVAEVGFLCEFPRLRSIATRDEFYVEEENAWPLQAFGFVDGGEGQQAAGLVVEEFA